MARRRSEQKVRESIASFSFFPSGPLPWKNLDPRQKQLKLEETDNAIIKAYSQAFGKIFFYSYLKWSLSRKLTNFSVAIF